MLPAIHAEAAVQNPAPEVEPLLDCREILRTHRGAVPAAEVEPDPCQRQAMGVLAQPRPGGRALLVWVGHLAAVAIIEGRRLVQRVSLRIREGVPAPFGLGR